MWTAYRLRLDDEQCEQQNDCKGQLRWISQEGEREVVYLGDPHSGAMKRFFLSLISLLPIEGQL